MDQFGVLHCWNCLSTNFERKLSAHTKVMSAVGGGASKKKLQCLVCGRLNEVEHAKRIAVPDTAPIPARPTSAGDPFGRRRRPTTDPA